MDDHLHANSLRVIQATDPYATPDPTESYNNFRTDPYGNLTFDGEYFYQYDAWNRLVQVNAAGEMIWQLFVAAGVPRPVACEDDLLLGRLVKHFIYDGVGRLVRTSSPIEAPEGFELSYTDGGTRRITSSATAPSPPPPAPPPPSAASHWD